MSYARVGLESDVYVFLSVSGRFECCACALGDREEFDSTDAMVAHLRDHINAGHMVPAHTIPRLEAKREENDAFLAQSGVAPLEGK